MKLTQTWRCFYEADPVPDGAVPELVLGGETAMWCAAGARSTPLTLRTPARARRLW